MTHPFTGRRHIHYEFIVTPADQSSLQVKSQEHHAKM